MDAAETRIGDLSETLFCEILASLSRAKETGVLRLSGPTAEKSVYLQQGGVVFASSKDPSDRLGELLLQRGIVTREQLEQAAAKVSPGKRLGTVLVELGFLPAEDLPRWVREQVKEIIFSLFAWIEGEYRFEPGPFPSREAITLRISTAEIFVTGLRRVQKWSVLRRGAGEIRIPYRLSPNHADLLRDVALGAEEKKVLALLGSRPLSMEKAAVESALSTLTVYQLFFAFRVLGVILASEEPVPVAKGQATDAPPAPVQPGEGKQHQKPAAKTLSVPGSLQEAEPAMEPAADGPLPDPSATLRFVPPAPAPPGPAASDEGKKQEKLAGKTLSVPKRAEERKPVAEPAADIPVPDPEATLRFVAPVPTPSNPVSPNVGKTEEKPAGKTRAAPKKAEEAKPRVAQTAAPSADSAPKAATQPESNPIGAQTVMLRMPMPQSPSSPKNPIRQAHPAAPEARLAKGTDGAGRENQAADSPEPPLIQPVTPADERPDKKKDSAPVQKAAAAKETTAAATTPTAPRRSRTEYKVVRMEGEKMDENGARQIEDLLRTWSGKGYRFAGVLPSKASGLFTSSGAFFFIFARDIPS